MNQNDFFENVKDAVLAKIKKEDESLEASISEVMKSNGQIYHGLTFRGCNNIQPIIYLDSLYERYSEGEKFDEIVDRVWEIYLSSRKNHDFDASLLTSFENAKNNIFAAVMNAELNATILHGMPHRLIEDLAIYYKVDFEFDDSGMGSVKVTNELLKSWGVSEEELHQVAVQNILTKHEVVCRDIFDVVRETIPDECELDELMEDSGMLVISNSHQNNGAVYIIAELGQLKKIAEAVNDDLIILPSSRNELILLKGKMADERSIDEFRNMVMEVNESNVSAEDFLSNNVYIFTRSTNELKIA